MQAIIKQTGGIAKPPLAGCCTKIVDCTVGFSRFGDRITSRQVHHPATRKSALHAKGPSEVRGYERDRVYLLWRQEGLKVQKKTRKRRCLGHSVNSCVRHRAEYMDQVWCWDFIQDRTMSGQLLKWLAITDEYTRKCWLEVDRSITGDELLNCEESANLAKSRRFARRRKEEHNEGRPHSSLNYQTPSAFAAGCAAALLRTASRSS